MAGLKENIGKRVLKNKKKGHHRDVIVHNFKTAKSAVILFDANEPETFQVIKDFRKFIEDQDIKCSAFGYVKQKEIPQEMLFWKNYSFITKSNLNWYLKPTGESVDAFFNQDPDMLIDFTRELPLELQFLVQLSSARFKIATKVALTNAIYMMKKALAYPTYRGQNSYKERILDSIFAFASQLIVSLYKDHGEKIGYSRNGITGTFERLYENEEKPEIREYFKAYVEQFKENLKVL